MTPAVQHAGAFAGAVAVVVGAAVGTAQIRHLMNERDHYRAQAQALRGRPRATATTTAPAAAPASPRPTASTPTGGTVPALAVAARPGVAGPKTLSIPDRPGGKFLSSRPSPEPSPEPSPAPRPPQPADCPPGGVVTVTITARRICAAVSTP